MTLIALIETAFLLYLDATARVETITVTKIFLKNKYESSSRQRSYTRLLLSATSHKASFLARIYPILLLLRCVNWLGTNFVSYGSEFGKLLSSST